MGAGQHSLTTRPRRDSRHWYEYVGVASESLGGGDSCIPLGCGPGETRGGYFTLQKLDHLPEALALLEELCTEAGRKDVMDRGLRGKRSIDDIAKAWKIVPHRRGDGTWLVGVYLPAHDMAVLEAAARNRSGR